MTNSIHKNKFWAVVPAAGVGQRMAQQTPKQYLSLIDKPIISHTLQRLLDHKKISGVIVALGDHDAYWADVHLKTTKPVIRVAGGSERCDSVLNALSEMLKLDNANQYGIDKADWVLVHDAARPCLRADDIDKLINTVLAADLSVHAGGLLALPVRDTMKRQNSPEASSVLESQAVNETVDRSGLWHALTPQMFPLEQLHQALTEAIDKQLAITDDSSAMEMKGFQPLLVEANEDNIKITRPADLQLAEMYLKAQADV